MLMMTFCSMLCEKLQGLHLLHDHADVQYEQLLVMLSNAIVDMKDIDLQKKDFSHLQDAAIHLFKNISSKDSILCYLIRKLLASIVTNVLLHSSILEFGHFEDQILILSELTYEFRFHSRMQNINHIDSQKIIVLFARRCGDWLEDVSITSTNTILVVFEKCYLVLKIYQRFLQINSTCSSTVIKETVEAFCVVILHNIKLCIENVAVAANCVYSHRFWRTIIKILSKISHLVGKASDEELFEIVKYVLSNVYFKQCKIIMTNFCGILPEYNSIARSHHLMHVNEQTWRKWVIFLLKVAATDVARQHNCHSNWMKDNLDTILSIGNPEKKLCVRWTIQQFSEDDQQLIALVTILMEIHGNIQLTDSVNVHRVFYHLLETISFDDSVVIDWLLHDDVTHCYVLKYLENYVTSFLSDIAAFLRITKQLETTNSVQSKHQKTIEKLFNQKHGLSVDLVDYSSSDCESDSDDDSEAHYDGVLSVSECAENIITCLTRLYFKLERTEYRNLLQTDVRVLLDLLRKLNNDFEYI